MAGSARRPAADADGCVRDYMDVPSPSIRWTVHAGAETTSEQVSSAHIEYALRDAEVVKDNPYRTIYRVHAAGNDWHIKHCKVRGLRAWLREWLRPAKAKLEYRQLSEAWRRGVPTVAPVAFGIARAPLPSDSYLVTRTVDGATPLNAFLEANVTAFGEGTRRVRLAQTLGTFVAAIHHAGLNHPDLHPGNILVRVIDEAPEFFLIDLHDSRFGGPLSRRASLQNLTLFNRWFALRTHRTDRLRFWRAYVVERFRLARRSVLDWDDCRPLEDQTRRSNLRFWRSRIARSLGASRHFVRVRGAGAAGYMPRGVPIAELDELLGDPDGPFRDPSRDVIKDSPSSTVAEITRTVNGLPTRLIYKRFRTRSVWQRLASLFRKTKCMRSWLLGNAFLDCLLPTARPLAVIERRRFGIAGEGYLLMERIERAIDLRIAINEQGPKARRIELVARLIRKLHERGWSHRDLKAANILLAPDEIGTERAWFIDLVGAKRPLWLSQSRRMRDLTRLNASFLDAGSLSLTNRLRFLLCYLNAALVGRAGWKDWWRGIGRRSLEKAAKNRARGRPLA
jgi:tRNA A-37 threonylcarbamoyl transferase component Bud32